jgi:hypothetical protein
MNHAAGYEQDPVAHSGDDDDDDEDSGSGVTSDVDDEDDDDDDDDDDSESSTSIDETNQQDETIQNLAKRETAFVRMWRTIVISAMVLTGALLTTGTYLVLRNQEKDEGQQKVCCVALTMRLCLVCVCCVLHCISFAFLCIDLNPFGFACWIDWSPCFISSHQHVMAITLLSYYLLILLVFPTRRIGRS